LGVALTALIHPLLGEKVMEASPNLYLGAVLGALLHFALPALLFGMAPPYIVRLSLANLASSGATVGRLYALSTAGSIVGTFLGGFVLISYFSCTDILFGTAAAASLLSLLVSARKNPLGIAVLLFGIGAAFGNASYASWQAAQGMLPTLETPYNTIRVLEGIAEGRRRVRLIQTDPGKIQSGMYLDDPIDLYAEYTRYYALGSALHPRAARVLMLGGGGYSVPKWLLAGRAGLDGAALKLDVVELDPGMTRIAREYFQLPDDPRMRVYHEDARRFLNTNTRQYDLIFVDVFNSYYSVPFQMGTKEAAQAFYRALAPGGMMIMNIISAYAGEHGLLFRSIHAAMAAAFPELHAFAVNNPNNLDGVQNIMLLALPEKRPDLAAAFAGDAAHLSQRTRTMLRTRITQAVTQDCPALTDNFAPVERYAQALLK
ncbi:MAG: fused MFS/spermidine synthase, partial [Desulfovibrionaceae bacterium]|nr:fused MFS/spermidine synthase [Desulfovibrionaceae bacterium]